MFAPSTSEFVTLATSVIQKVLLTSVYNKTADSNHMTERCLRIIWSVITQ